MLVVFFSAFDSRSFLRRSSISFSLAAVFTGLAAPNIDDAEATGAEVSSTGIVRGAMFILGRSFISVVAATGEGSGLETTTGASFCCSVNSGCVFHGESL